MLVLCVVCCMALGALTVNGLAGGTDQLSTNLDEQHMELFWLPMWRCLLSIAISSDDVQAKTMCVVAHLTS